MHVQSVYSTTSATHKITFALFPEFNGKSMLMFRLKFCRFFYKTRFVSGIWFYILCVNCRFTLEPAPEHCFVVIVDTHKSLFMIWINYFCFLRLLIQKAWAGESLTEHVYTCVGPTHTHTHTAVFWDTWVGRIDIYCLECYKFQLI